MSDPAPIASRDELASDYLDQLVYPPYPVQEEALLNWFSSDQGLLVCAPTGTGKTLIAEAAIYEALRTGRRAYYTTPLIALTEQKLTDLQASAERWGFSANQVGLVTGNRRVNPDAPILVVVAEILFNRLLHPEQFCFDDVCAVVMDEFHSFNDPERGIVWEFSLGLLPAHIRLMLLSATVGNAYEFTSWLRRTHRRSLELVQSDERKIPLSYRWVGDQLLSEQLELMAAGSDESRYTPALVFCFNRDECWDVAEMLKGKGLLHEGQQKQLAQQLEQYDWSRGAGPKLKQLLYRGVGVHHAGVLPIYRRIVEDLFQRKLLSVCICTETLAAGINLPARSVVLPDLMKGPPDKKRLIDPSSAHQMFGRAGRPQYDTQGFVFVLAHEDDVKILRWREKYDQIPEDTKDPKLRLAKKALKKKMPTRRANQAYWEESHFERLKQAKPAQLASRGPLPWRLLTYMFEASPEVAPIRTLVGKRLMDEKRQAAAQKSLDRMLLMLWTAGYVELEPHPPRHTLLVRGEATEERSASEPQARRPYDRTRLASTRSAETAPSGRSDDEAAWSTVTKFFPGSPRPTASPSAAGVSFSEPSSAITPAASTTKPAFGLGILDDEPARVSHPEQSVSSEPPVSSATSDAATSHRSDSALTPSSPGSPPVARPAGQDSTPRPSADREGNALAESPPAAPPTLLWGTAPSARTGRGGGITGSKGGFPSVGNPAGSGGANAARPSLPTPAGIGPKKPLLETRPAIAGSSSSGAKPAENEDTIDTYRAEFAYPTESLSRLLVFRGVNPIYGVFLANHLGIADRNERLQAIESVLEMPGSVARTVRVPKPDQMPPGPLAVTRLDTELLRLGLVTPAQLGAVSPDEEEKPDRRGSLFEEERVWVLTLAEKLKLLFDHDFPDVHDVSITPVWAAGEILEFGGDFNKYITSKGLQKQEGILFRHLLRMILMLAEFAQIIPPETTEDEWQGELESISRQLTDCCYRVDPTSTDKAIEQAAEIVAEAQA